MSKKKFIGGGFPGIRLCNDDKELLTKESIIKREFSTKLVSIANILKNKRTNRTIKSDTLDNLNIKKPNYNSIENILHNTQTINYDFDINLINKPIN